jgi:amidohydrolase
MTIQDILPEIKRLRQQLHAIAEKSGEEHNTAAFVVKELEKCLPAKILTGVGGTGVVAQFNGAADGNHTVIRCELDALPIQEVNTFDHKSKTAGVSHKCGHDGHMSILLGVAKYLHKNPLKKGKASLLFQPAEENGLGARAMIDSGRLKELGKIDKVYSLHNLPGHEKRRIYCRAGVFTPHVISYEVRLFGKESHAAEPENGINPALAMAEITQALSKLQQTDKQKAEYKLIVPVFSKLGQLWYGISAGYGELGFTMRTWDTAILRKLQANVEAKVKEIASAHRLRCETRFFEEFYSVNNDTECAREIESSAKKAGLEFEAMKNPVSWGEDFGLFTDVYPGAMFGLGSGMNIPALHNPDYDFPDEIAGAGIGMFVELIEYGVK